MCKSAKLICALALLTGLTITIGMRSAAAASGKLGFYNQFHLQEATIDEVEEALKTHQITCLELVKRYFNRIAAYNGTCVNQPDGLLGSITTIPNAGQLDAYGTINLRPGDRAAWGFDQHHARSQTDLVDNDPNMPDALEVAASLDAQYASTGKMGPLFCVPMGIKDEYDTFDMRTRDGADAFYANDRPPDDAAAVAKLRAAGAVLLGKTTMGEYASNVRSSFGGTPCNPYDTQRTPSGSSAGSGVAVSSNLALCAMAEETAGSVIGPSDADGDTGLAPTEQLNSRQGLIPATLMNDRVGVICRTARDISEVEEVLAGYDSNDPLTAFSVGEAPPLPYPDYTQGSVPPYTLTSIKGVPLGLDPRLPLKGITIGVLRENMVAKDDAQVQPVQIVENAISALQALGAEIVDPGIGGSIFTDNIAQQFTYLEPQTLEASFPALFSGGDPIDQLVALFYDTSQFPTGAGAPTITNLGPESTTGERKYVQNRWLAGRSDANIHNIEDLINHSNFWSDVNPNVGTPYVASAYQAAYPKSRQPPPEFPPLPGEP